MLHSMCLLLFILHLCKVGANSTVTSSLKKKKKSQREKLCRIELLIVLLTVQDDKIEDNDDLASDF